MAPSSSVPRAALGLSAGQPQATQPRKCHEMNYQRRSVLHGLAVLPIGSLSSRVDLNGRNLVARDGRELAAALRLARPGTVIGLAAGEFGGVAQFEIGVPEVTLRSLTPSAAVLRAPVVVTAGGATLADLAFHGEGDDGFYLAAVAACSDSLATRPPRLSCLP